MGGGCDELKRGGHGRLCRVDPVPVLLTRHLSSAYREGGALGYPRAPLHALHTTPTFDLLYALFSPVSPLFALSSAEERQSLFERQSLVVLFLVVFLYWLYGWVGKSNSKALSNA